jgi:acetyl-CoA C-acetyltransferase
MDGKKMDWNSVADNTPILVGAGQVVEREVTDDSPMVLAAEAARRALAHAGGGNLPAAIDTLSVTRLFADSMGMPPCPFGRSNNPPMSIARAIGAAPAHCIYGLVGGNDPQSRVIEFAGAIARGERSVVLLAGAEAIRNQRNAERSGRVLDWNDTFDEAEFPLEDRGWGDLFVTMQEVHNGLFAPMSYYALIEQARAFAAGRSIQEQRLLMTRLLVSLNEVAAANPYAQFPAALSAEDILSADSLNHVYTRRMVAQDGVNQGAALLLCSVGAARQLGIPREHWVFLHGLAEGADVNLSEREDLGRSFMAEAVLERAMAGAGRTIDDIGLIDLYSCFPCAVASSAEALGLPADGSRDLTLTGGLPYFGGAGNNYGMHALAEAVSQLRESPESCALVASLGGIMSKHAVGIYSGQPASLDYVNAEIQLDSDMVPRKAIIAAPEAGVVKSHVVNYKGGEPVQAIVIAETGDGLRFVANSIDPETVAAVLSSESAGLAISVTPGDKGALHFIAA